MGLTVYRCNFLNQDRRICDRDDFHARDDNEAVESARSRYAQQNNRFGFELWSGTKLVHAEKREEL
jgi:hypothetical protein